ncbi:PF20097 family protein [Rhodopirellula baltica]|uniref:PF20097 family protein n=1 Tax=Rhodopirellula baltica TaxID=265606 RepID=UPI00055E707B
MTKRICPDCNVEMEKGFVPDFSDGTAMVACWHPGVPENQTLMGLQVSRGAIKHDRNELKPITTYRCAACGSLRFYAS